MVKEVCVESYGEALAAYERGVDRIELCENLAVGGTTPSFGTVKMCKRLPIATFVMIRARGGDFTYSQEEIEIMKEDTKLFLDSGVDGLVFGFLTKENKIDYPLLKEFMDIIKSYNREISVTFHKAIDEIESPEDEILRLADYGVTRILTSGKEITALEGRELLNKMIEIAKDKIKIVVAGRVTSLNIDEVASIVPNSEYHGKKIV